MKILHTTAFYHPRAGGAEEVVRQLSERLVSRGHDVTVATTALPERQTHFHNGVQVAQFDIHGVLGHSAIGIRGEAGSFRDLLHVANWDIVLNYAAQTWTTDLTCLELTRIRAKTVFAACGYSGLLGARRLLYEGYFRRLPRYLRRYDAIVYHSANYQDKHFGDAHGIHHYRVIPNGIDPLEFAEPPFDFRRKYNIKTRYVLVSVGNHFTNKGHDRVLKAFELLGSIDATLVLIGQASAPRLRSCYQACKRAARSNPRILMLDDCPRTHVVAALFAADLFLFGSRIEAFPLVILEAMASGTAWIAFPAGNIPELPGGVVVRRSVQMAAVALRLLNDGKTRAALAETGLREQRERYTWDKVVDQYEHLYRALLSGDAVEDRALDHALTP